MNAAFNIQYIQEFLKKVRISLTRELGSMQFSRSSEI